VKRRAYVLAAYLLLAVGAAGCGSNDDSRDELAATATTTPAEETNTAADTGLVGEWSTENVCEDQVRAFKEAGLPDPGTEWAEFPGHRRTETDPCHGAKPVEHSHSFGENGSFASYDQNGEQVDEGTYTPVDDRTFTLGDPSVTVHYRIEGDRATFDVGEPTCQTKRCRESAAYVTSVFFPRTYERVR
jgi:hypothetical protein